jgi:hypothetical protein
MGAGLCHQCPHGLKTLNNKGDVVWSTRGDKMLQDTNSEWEKMPCSSCTLNKLSGMNYNKGRDIVSMDSMEGERGDDFNKVDPTYSSEYYNKKSEYDVLLLPLGTLLHISNILRTLDPKIRLLVEYKLEHPCEMLSDCARAIGIEPNKSYTYLNRAKKEHPLLHYLLDKDKKSITKTLQEQREKDDERYKKIESYLDD